jgi:hypothetical protein
MTSAPTPLPVHVVGIVRGRGINALGTIALDHDALVLEWPQSAAWRLALDGIEGLGMGAHRARPTGARGARPIAMCCRRPTMRGSVRSWRHDAPYMA